MPIPNPNASETQDDFIQRCMIDLKNEYLDQEQRLAICYQQWRSKK
jgi:MoxR-like ATPase